MSDPAIPAEIMMLLDRLRPHLQRQGVVQLHHGQGRGKFYRLRFREYDDTLQYTRHRSLALGADPSVARAVAAQIQRWQDEHAAKKQAESAKAAETPAAPPVDPARGVAQELCGGGFRRRRQIGEWYDNALNDPVAMLRFNVTGAFPARRKGGRPPKQRSW